MMFLALAAAAAAAGANLVPQSETLPFIPDWNSLVCVSPAKFSETIDSFGIAKWTQTIETPSFPGLARLIIVTVKNADDVGVTKEIFGGRNVGGKDCVVLPALFVDHKPNAVPPLPILMFAQDPPGQPL